jgi:hypothetical protein
MAQTSEKKHPKVVHSDLKDAKPEKPPVLMHHDLEETPPSRKDRWPEPPGGRSDHVPHAVPRGENERRGGRDRQERKRRHVGSAAS